MINTTQQALSVGGKTGLFDVIPAMYGTTKSEDMFEHFG